MTLNCSDRMKLAYRRAVLIEQAERLYIRTSTMPPGAPRRRSEMELMFIRWRIREMEKLVPNLAEAA